MYCSYICSAYKLLVPDRKDSDSCCCCCCSGRALLRKRRPPPRHDHEHEDEHDAKVKRDDDDDEGTRRVALATKRKSICDAMLLYLKKVGVESSRSLQSNGIVLAVALALLLITTRYYTILYCTARVYVYVLCTSRINHGKDSATETCRKSILDLFLMVVSFADLFFWHSMWCYLFRVTVDQGAAVVFQRGAAG
jgi:hypothetical protein